MTHRLVLAALTTIALLTLSACPRRDRAFDGAKRQCDWSLAFSTEEREACYRGAEIAYLKSEHLVWNSPINQIRAAIIAAQTQCQAEFANQLKLETACIAGALNYKDQLVADDSD